MNIGVVIVSFNRLDKLKITLDLFEKQIKKPQYILIVDNASTDGTQQFLDVWKNTNQDYIKYVVNLENNLGGSGGFYTGLEKAAKLEADWIWVSDDDAFPEETALNEADEYLKSHQDELKYISAICGQVINKGRIDLSHRKNLIQRGLNVNEQFIPESEYAKKEFNLNGFSYVGTIINKSKLKEAGYTLKDYFIWLDDTEHSLRLNKIGRIVCVPAIKIHHDAEISDHGISWKTYYGLRNNADLLRRHFSVWSYNFYCFKKITKAYLDGKNTDLSQITIAAITDAKHNRFGIHNTYKPGWNLKNLKNKEH